MKDKEYKVIYGIKMHTFDCIVPLIFSFFLGILISKCWKYFISLDGSEEITAIIGFGIFGYICAIILLIYLIFTFVHNAIRIDKQREGEIIMDELYFMGSLKEVQEIKPVIERKFKKPQIKIIYKEK